MLRKKLESESGTEIADSGFLIIYEKPADSGSRIRIAIPEENYEFLYVFLLYVLLTFQICIIAINYDNKANYYFNSIAFRTCTAPLDRLKVMLQVHGGRKKLTMVDAMKYMIREGGYKVGVL